LAGQATQRLLINPKPFEQVQTLLIKTKFCPQLGTVCRTQVPVSDEVVYPGMH
jgi:hypothetical protein